MLENIIIDEDWIQSTASTVLDEEREEEGYTDEELGEIRADLEDNLWEFILERADDVIQSRALLHDNEGAENSLPHYRVYYRNQNAFGPEFREGPTFHTEEDAKKYFHHEYEGIDEDWKIIKVDQDGEHLIFTKDAK